MKVAAPVFRVDLEAHRGYLDGAPIPSVTQVIKAQGMINDAYFTEDGRERGSDIHALTQFYDEGDLFLPSVDDAYRGRLEGFIRFRKENPKFKPRLIEQVVYNPTRRFWGILDRVEVHGSREAVLDVKSGAEDDATGPQTAGYDDALTALEGPPPGGFRERFGLYLRDDGTYRLVPYTDAQDRFVFLSAVSVVTWNLRKRGESYLWPKAA